MTVQFRLLERGGNPDFLDLPWTEPLASWDHERLVRVTAGIHRHVVRFVHYDGAVYALKETDERSARHEYGALRRILSMSLPAVTPVGVVYERSDRDGEPLGSVLITRYLDYSLPYRYLFGRGSTPGWPDRLLDAAVVLLVRLHLSGTYWGDCSLSNMLFTRDAGALAATLVDAETAEFHDAPLNAGLRANDLQLAVENMTGGFLDLAAAGRFRDDLDPIELVLELEHRYEELWSELTREEVVAADDRERIGKRLQRINALGFDVDEMSVVSTEAGNRLRFRPLVVEEGHHARQLERLTGLRVQENQARRLLNDIWGFSAWLEHTEGARPPEAVAAYRWLTEVFEPATALIPPDYVGRLAPAEFYHQLLEHRWLLSEEEGRPVRTPEAMRSLLDDILAHRPDERQVLLTDAADDIEPPPEVAPPWWAPDDATGGPDEDDEPLGP
ncbi:MAG: DUF4032 domain-containing protein [Actinomycetota bacterium]|nr:DUF4032 domain-containing protein [Actinomycetota bacterium]